MDRIDGANYVTVGGKRQFSAGSPGVSPPTSLTPKFFTDAQEELIAGAIEPAGLTPADNTVQLLSALRLLGLNAQNAKPFHGSSNAGSVRCYMWSGIDGTHGTRLDITINAAWDSGGSQWVPDSSGSPSIMLRLAAGANGGIAPSAANIEIYRNDSGAAFAEAAWSRSVNGVHALNFNSGHWSNNGGASRPGTYQVGIDGRVQLTGILANDGTAGVAAIGLPANAGASMTFAIPIYNGSALTVGTAQIDGSGNLTIGASGSGVLAYLDGVSYSLDS